MLFYATATLQTDFKPFFQTNKLQWEDAEGLRQKLRGEMNALDRQMSEMRGQIEGQQSIIEKQLRTVYV